ncbi:ABC transporter permease [Empedobacter brevis]|uniref:ABC transporter permease n=1 Tax=Empedobacter brevis TaxID=247 RepID=A0AAJ1V6F3_9FLAO|nr:ABC transporter permease [Empedobacter brevis]MDM1071182.1 ABC transporter permease [Empedobacter brevis]
MLKNWFKIYVHNAIKNKGFTFLTILGLAIGIAGVIFSTLYWKNETSYNEWNPNKDRIFETLTGFPVAGEVWPTSVEPLPRYLKEKSDKIESFCWFEGWYGQETFHIGQKKVYVEGIVRTDQKFFDFIPFKFTKGNVADFRKNQYGVAIEESEAIKIFGKENPVGKILTTYDGRKMPIYGVFKAEKYTSFQPKMVISNIYSRLEDTKDNWGNYGSGLFIKLKNPADKLEVEKLATQLFYENNTVKNAQREGVSVEEFSKIYEPVKVQLQPLKDSRLNAKVSRLPEGMGNKLFLQINLGLSYLILILSIINYINLSTAQAIRRAKEVGIRKVVGATKRNIVVQFIVETTITTVLAFVVALALVEVGLPGYNQLIDKNLEIEIIPFIPYLVAIFIVVVMIAGIFPAIYVSNFKELNVLKGNFSRSKNGIWLRNAMLILQFSIATFFIVGGTIVIQQMQYLGNKDLGFSGDQVISIPFKRQDLGENKFNFYKSYQQDLAKIKGVQGINATAFKFGSSGAISNTSFRVKDKQLVTDNMAIDFGFLNMMKIEVKEGRDLDPKISSDTISSVLINETAKKHFGETLKLNDEFDWNNQKLKLVGVTKDFNLGEPQAKIRPMMFFHFKVVQWMPSNLQNILIKVDTEHTKETIDNIETFWKAKVDNDYPFEYEFVDKQFARSYENYTKQEKMFKILNAIVITIALFGLFALSSYTIERKYKEIAIRKVLGAETSSLLKILSKQYVYFAIIGFVLAVVPSYFFVQKWLENFVYRIDISIWVYIFAFVLLLCLTLIVVLLKAYAATRINILNYLKYE